MKPKKKKVYFTEHTIIALLIIVIVCFLAVPVVYHYETQMTARQVLREAKNVQLSMRLVAAEYYGARKVMYSSKTETGLKSTAEEEILELAQAEGNVRVLRWDGERYIPESFAYDNGKYVVTYDVNSKGESIWNVYRLSHIVSHE